MDLPEISQEFDADVTKYIAGLEEMIDMGTRFVYQCEKDAAAVEELELMLDHLDSKVIEVITHFSSTGDTIDSEQLAAIDAAREELSSLGDEEEIVAVKAMMARAAIGEFGEEVRGLNDEAMIAQMAVEALTGKMADSTEAASREGAAIADSAVKMTAKERAAKDLKDALDNLGLSEEDAANLFELSGNAIFKQGAAAEDKTQKIRALMEENGILTDGEEDLSTQIENAVDKMHRAAAAADEDTQAVARYVSAMEGATSGTEDAGNAAQGAEKRIRLLGTGFAVTGYQLHWLIAGSAEFLAVFVPAMIAAGAAAGAMAEGVGWIKDRLMATFETTEATSAMIGETTGNVLGLKASLQETQTAADPQIWELLGAAVNACKESFGDFWSQGGAVVHMLDDFGAHLDLVLGPGGVLGGQAEGAIKDMVNDLRLFGQILGNVGHILLSLATDMPGLAEVIFGVISTLTGFLNILLQFKGVGYFVTIAMGLEELGRWGGLLMRIFAPMVGLFGRLTSQLGAATMAIAGTDEEILLMDGELNRLSATALITGDAMVTVGAEAQVMGDEMATAGEMTKTLRGTFAMLFTTDMGGFLLGAAGATALAIALSRLQTAAQAAVGGMMSGIDSDTPIKAFSQMLNQLPQMQQAANQAAQAQNYVSDSWKKGTVDARDAAGAIAYLRSNTGAYTNAVNFLTGNLASMMSAQFKVNGTTYGLVQGMALATAAGVQMGQMFNQQGNLSAFALQMIKNLIVGYQDMAQTGSVLSQDINAIDVQTLMQQTDVDKLNQAWDSFLSTVTGGTSSLASLNDDLETIGNVTTSLNTKVTAFSQEKGGIVMTTNQIAKALQSFGGQSAQIWQNYDSAVTQAGQVTDWLRTAAAAGGVTAAQYGESIKGVVAELLPYAKESRTATAELDALAQQAGGPTTTSYQTLAAWVGNTKEDQKELNSTVQQATQFMSNLGAVAANLSDTMNSEVDSAIATGATNFQGIAKAAQSFASELRNGTIDSTPFNKSLVNMVGQLKAAGEPITDITKVLDIMATRAGYSAAQIKLLNAEIDHIHSTKATIQVVTQAIGGVGQAVGVSLGSSGSGSGSGSGGHYNISRAAGGRVPGGYGGGDVVHAMLEPGEAVVPKHLVSSIAPFLGSHGVPGFAKGGYVPDNYPIHLHPKARKAGETPMERVISQWSKEIWGDYLRQFGEKGPISIAKMREIMGPEVSPNVGLWANPQYKQLRLDERLEMDPYYIKDLMYSKVLGQEGSLRKSEAAQIAKYRADERKGDPSETAYWTSRYEQDAKYDVTQESYYKNLLKSTTNKKLRDDYLKDIARYAKDAAEYEKKAANEKYYYRNEYEADIKALEKTDARKLLDYQRDARSLLRGMGYSRGGMIPFGSYDSGGYLPVGLSMALNNTGRPEPVGGGGVGGGPVHVHMHVGSREIAEAILPDLVASTARYNTRNSGRNTGLLKPS